MAEFVGLGSSSTLPAGALTGKYVGVGANASVGGSRNSVFPQPLSVQAQTSLNVAAGVAGLRLTHRGYVRH